MPSTPVNPLNLEEFLPYKLSLLSNTISGAIADAYAERFDLSMNEWRVMAVLGRFPGLSAREITERTAIDKVAVSRAVKRLLDARRIERVQVPEDKRSFTLTLSEEGTRVHDQVAPLARDYERKLLDSLNDEQKRALNELIGLLSVQARCVRA